MPNEGSKSSNPFSFSMTRRRLVGAMSALMALSVSSRAFAQDATPLPTGSPVAPEAVLPPTPIPLEPLPLLFIQTAAQGSWSAMRGQPGAFRLDLMNPSPQTIVIRDQPTNTAGTISTALFLDSIGVNEQQPLHAVISAQSATGEDVLIVALSKVTYVPTIARLSYVATKLDDYSNDHGLTSLASQQANFTLPPSFGATTVFITNAFCRLNGDDMCHFG